MLRVVHEGFVPAIPQVQSPGPPVGLLAQLVEARAAAERPIVSVVIPTRNEAGNIEILLRRLERVAPALPLEIIFVDDSTDETPRTVEEVGAGCARVVRLIHRPPDRRIGGLGGAVVEGMREARGEWVCVMDAD